MNFECQKCSRILPLVECEIEDLCTDCYVTWLDDVAVINELFTYKTENQKGKNV